MKAQNSNTLSLLNSMKMELHGHKKKTTFFSNALKNFINSNGVSPNNLSILEIGCSNGSLVTLPLAEQGYNILGIDLHEPSINQANNNNKFENAAFQLKNLVDFESSEIFDVIILSDILEHVDDPKHLLDLSYKHLSNGGLILVSVPNGFGPSELERKFLEKTKIIKLINLTISFISKIIGRKSSAYNSDSGHIQFFKMKELKNLYKSTNLKIETFQKGALFGGALSYPLGKLLPFIVKPSLFIADKIHFNLVSTWYFSLKKNK